MTCPEAWISVVGRGLSGMITARAQAHTDQRVLLLRHEDRCGLVTRCKTIGQEGH
jgi:monoamine oxidase